MEKYIVNGVEIQYDTFDADNIETWDDEVERVAEETQTPRAEDETASGQLRRICNAMLDLFDNVCGEGTSYKVFGDRVNVKEIYEGYASLVQQVNQSMKDFAAGAPALLGAEQNTVIPMNREQRRKAEHNSRQ